MCNKTKPKQTKSEWKYDRLFKKNIQNQPKDIKLIAVKHLIDLQRNSNCYF